jgi:hypothetical protein
MHGLQPRDFGDRSHRWIRNVNDERLGHYAPLGKPRITRRSVERGLSRQSAGGRSSEANAPDPLRDLRSAA